MQALTVSNDFPKIFNYGDVYLGLTGLATDVTSVFAPPLTTSPFPFRIPTLPLDKLC